MKENANKASSILLTAIPQISQMDWAQTIKTLKVSERSHPSEEVVKADVDDFLAIFEERGCVILFYVPLLSMRHLFVELLQEQSSHLLLSDNTCN